MAEEITIRDDQGREYDVNVLKSLYDQIAPNFDASRSSGTVFKENVSDRTNIGFNSKEAEKVFGKTPSAAQMVVLDMARGLARAGVTDISQLKQGTVTKTAPDGESGQEYAYQSPALVGSTGQEVTLGNTFTGKGGTRYDVDIGPDGKPKFFTEGFDTSDKQAILMGLSVLAPFALGPLIGAAGAGAAGLGNVATAAGVLGGSTAAAGSGLAGMLSSAGLSATAANALASGLVHGTFRGGIADLAGGKFGKGFASGFVGGAAPVVAGPATQALTTAGLSPELAKIVTSGGIGGLSAAAGGKDVGAGALGAALNTGVNIGLDKFGAETGLNKLPAPVKGIATQGITAALTGKPFDAGQALQNAAINYGLGQTLGPQGTKALNTFMQFKNTFDGINRMSSGSRSVPSAQQSAMDKFKAFKAGRP